MGMTPTNTPKPEARVVEEIAKALWHRFGDDTRLEWEDEREQDIYLDAAAQVIVLAAAPAAPDAACGELMFYVQDSRQYVGNCPLWWCPDGAGYTTRLDKAGKYTSDAAMSQHRARGTDIPWPCEQIDALRRPTVDMQDMRRLTPLTAALAGDGGKPGASA